MGQILLVDDDEDLRDLMKSLLEDAGFELDLAISGNNALKFLNENSYNLVITDYLMPDGRGDFLIDQIQSKWPDTKTLLLTGGGKINDEEEREKLEQIPADRLVKKPFQYGEFIELVKELLGKSAA